MPDAYKDIADYDDSEEGLTNAKEESTAPDH